GASISVGAGVLDRLGVGGAEARLEHRRNDIVPGAIDHRFVRQDGIAGSGARERERPDQEKDSDEPRAESRGATASPAGIRSPTDQPYGLGHSARDAVQSQR